jgi:hypothetical protein
VETYPLKNPSSWRRRGKQRKPKHDGKAAASFLLACSSWCQEVLGYLPRTRLRARGMSQGFFWQLCSRDEQPNHPYHKNSSSNWEIEEEEEKRKAKACALQDLFFAP